MDLVWSELSPWLWSSHRACPLQIATVVRGWYMNAQHPKYSPILSLLETA